MQNYSKCIKEQLNNYLNECVKLRSNIYLRTQVIIIDLAGFGFALLFQFVCVLVDCIKHSFRHFLLPALRHHQWKVAVQLLICLCQLDIHKI